MNKVVRKEGYIDLDIFMKENKCQNLLCQKEAELHSMFCGSKVKYAFMHEKEMWIYKYEEFPYFCYAELVAEELAHNFKIRVAHYDLALSYTYGRGVLTKNFRKQESNYVIGFEVLKNYVEKELKITEQEEMEETIEKMNSLEGIGKSLEFRYRTHPRKNQILEEMWEEFTTIFIYDLLTGNMDRHEYNWGIEEQKDKIVLQPIYDNERLLYFDSDVRMLPYINSTANHFQEFEQCLDQVILDFISISKNALEKLEENLKWIEEENLNRIFEKIAYRTQYPVPEEIKYEMLFRFQKIERISKEILNQKKDFSL